MCGIRGERFRSTPKKATVFTHPAPARQDAPFRRQGPGERRPEAYPLGRTVRRIRSTTFVRAADW